MAKEVEKKEVNKKEPINKRVEEGAKKKDTLKDKPAPKKKEIKPYVHIDTYIQTAKVLYDLNSMQIAGFKSRMVGRHYQRDEKVFDIELKEYLNIK